MNAFKVITPTRDIARELARKYSTMTHSELDVLESILEPIKYGKGEKILVEGEVCKNISYIEMGLVERQGSDGTFGCGSFHLHVNRKSLQGRAYEIAGGGA